MPRKTRGVILLVLLAFILCFIFLSINDNSHQKSQRNIHSFELQSSGSTQFRTINATIRSVPLTDDFNSNRLKQIDSSVLKHSHHADNLIQKSSEFNGSPGSRNLVNDSTIALRDEWKGTQEFVRLIKRRLTPRPTPQPPTLTSTPIPTHRGGCPASYNITGPDNEWFRTKVAQKSPLGNNTDVEELPRILILTPISNSERHLTMYFQNVCSLTYPHHLISIVLGEDSSLDGTVEAARSHADTLRTYFHRIEIVQLKSLGRMLTGNARHAPHQQYARRRHLASSRNQLLFAGIEDEKWVLWMDSDVKHIPVDLTERLLAVNKQIVVPNILYRQNNGQTDTFDRNTWKETEASRRALETADTNFLMIEGYAPTKRLFLNDLKEQGDVVKIDGVGGCVLLVNADLHRKGLVFPAFTFEHHIETEGLAKMAAKLEIEIYGLPSVNVIHA